MSTNELLSLPAKDAQQVATDMDRADFETSIKKEVSTGKTQAICHSISSQTIKNGIFCPVNEFLNQKITIDMCMKYLNNLANALYNNKTSASVYDISIVRKVNSKIQEICKDLISKDINKLNRHCVELYKFMFNVRFNLRAGNSSWNSSVQDAFDPEEWYYVEMINNVATIKSHYENSNCEPTPCDMINAFKNRTPMESGFYLTSKNDGSRLSNMALTMGYSQKPFKIVSSRNDKNRLFVYSSSNFDELVPNSAKAHNNKKIFYYYDLQWQQF